MPSSLTDAVGATGVGDGAGSGVEGGGGALVAGTEGAGAGVEDTDGLPSHEEVAGHGSP